MRAKAKHGVRIFSRRSVRKRREFDSDPDTDPDFDPDPDSDFDAGCREFEWSQS